MIGLKTARTSAAWSGADLCTTILQRGWILARPASGAVRLSEAAKDGLRSALGLEVF